MKNKLLFSTILIFLLFPNVNFGQAPSIITQPVNQVVCVGTLASFSVAATGTALTYQWRKGSVNLSDGGNISGSNTATLTINPTAVADASSDYNVIVSGSIAPNDTSVNAILDVNTPPNITIQPTSQSICTGDTVRFSVMVTGFNLTYQWRKGTTDLVSGGNVLDATAATLVIFPATIADTAFDYNVIVSGGCPPSETSTNAALLINSPPQIIAQPTNQTVCIGSSASFSVAALGTGLTYQWRKGSTNLINGGNISGATTATLLISPVTALDTASNYNVVIVGDCPPPDTSIQVYLRYNNTKIISQPTNQTVCAGSSASFSVNVSGTGITYQWRKGNVNLINGGNISGANTATLTINPATISDTSSFYNVIITGACAFMDTSINVSLFINTAPNINTQPISQTVCTGNSASFSVGASGTSITYQWRKGNVNLVNGGNISGATTATLTINPATISDTSSFYNVVVTGVCAPKDTSINVALFINATPNIITQPVSQTVCADSPASFSVAASGTGITYQWRKGNVNLVNGGNILGATTATLTINPATISDTSSFYNVVVTGACAPSYTSINVFLHVNPLPSVTVNASATTVCAGSLVTLTGGGAVSYAWTGGVTNGVAFTPTVTNSYTVTGTNANNCANTATIMVTVNNLPPIVPTSNSPVCVGSPINLSTTTVIGATYNWAGPNGFTSTSQNPSIASATLADAGIYSLTVTYNGCNSDPTVNVIVNNCNVGNADLSVVKTVNNTHPVVGSTITFTITASNKGQDNATGVVVSDTLQNGYTYVSSTVTVGSYNPSTGVWTIGALNNGALATLFITVKVNATGNYINTAIIHGNQADTNMANNISSVETFPVNPPEFFIPEGFSPNNDGINDLFVIRGIESYPHNSFTIFNRWGDKVFGEMTYQNTWDGKSTTGMRMGGDDLPVGTYFYTLDLGDGSKVYKGSIYLNR
jgi:uncharacterized repeat protein (TIGR01451 family)/gliding motility-associated-like protein